MAVFERASMLSYADRERYRLHAKQACYARRVSEAGSIIREGLAIGPAYVGFSGGKDSMALLHLAAAIKPDIPAYFIDSGAETPDTLDAIAAMRARGHLVRTIHPERTIIELCRAAGFWGAKPDGPITLLKPADFKRALIEEPAARIRHAGYPVALLGLRMEESLGRQSLSRHGPIHQYRHGGWRACPLRRWSGSDVIAYCQAHELPLSAVYLDADDRERERRRTGTALGTQYQTYGRFQRLRRRHPALWQELIRTFPRLRQSG